ncbi:MAG: RIP metalloprotease RseP [Bacillota bacterium]
MGIIIAILIFLILIVAHEFGHFIIAKINKVRVTEFCIGLGPKIWGVKRKGGETEFALRALPIGGACMMVGEDEDNDDPKAFNKKTIPQRIAIVAGGPAMNFVVAIVIFVVIFTGMGVASQGNVVGEVVANQPAAQAGLRSGDAILSVNGLDTASWSDIVATVQEQPAGEPLLLGIEREGVFLEFTATPYYDQDNERWLIGIMPITEKVGVIKAIGLGFKQCFVMTKLLLVTLFQILTGQVPADVAGPVGVVSIVGQTVQSGLQNVLVLAAFLSINLGVINLLPIPALDGSRIIFLIVEGIRRKPVKNEALIHFIGFAALIVLMVVITYKDVLRLMGDG